MKDSLQIIFWRGACVIIFHSLLSVTFLGSLLLPFYEGAEHVTCEYLSCLRINPTSYHRLEGALDTEA